MDPSNTNLPRPLPVPKPPQRPPPATPAGHPAISPPPLDAPPLLPEKVKEIFNKKQETEMENSEKVTNPDTTTDTTVLQKAWGLRERSDAKGADYFEKALRVKKLENEKWKRAPVGNLFKIPELSTGLIETKEKPETASLERKQATKKADEVSLKQKPLSEKQVFLGQLNAQIEADEKKQADLKKKIDELNAKKETNEGLSPEDEEELDALQIPYKRLTNETLPIANKIRGEIEKSGMKKVKLQKGVKEEADNLINITLHHAEETIANFKDTSEILIGKLSSREKKLDVVLDSVCEKCEDNVNLAKKRKPYALQWGAVAAKKAVKDNKDNVVRDKKGNLKTEDLPITAQLMMDRVTLPTRRNTDEMCDGFIKKIHGELFQNALRKGLKTVSEMDDTVVRENNKKENLKFFQEMTKDRDDVAPKLNNAYVALIKAYQSRGGDPIDYLRKTKDFFNLMTEIETKKFMTE